MKKLMLALHLFLSGICLGQNNYYQMEDSLYTEAKIKVIIETVAKTIPGNNILKPVVYYKEIKNDSIINHLAFHALSKRDSGVVIPNEIVYEQDPLYLLLNQPIPEFELENMEGNKISLSKLSGKPVFINFWSTSCKPCIEEIPQLNLLKDKYGDQVHFVAIADGTCNENDIENMLEKTPFHFTILKNGDNYKDLLNVTSVPKSLFVDKNGIIRYIRGGLTMEKDAQTGQYQIKSNKIFDDLIRKLVIN